MILKKTALYIMNLNFTYPFKLRLKQENGGVYPDWKSCIVEDFLVESKIKGEDDINKR